MKMAGTMTIVNSTQGRSQGHQATRPFGYGFGIMVVGESLDEFIFLPNGRQPAIRS